MIRLIATDLDGTLLDSLDQVPQANRDALARAVEQAVLLVLVTARKVSTTTAVAAELNLPCARIMHSGARTVDWNETELRHFRLPPEMAAAIADAADAVDLDLITTVDEVNYYAGSTHALAGLHDVLVPSNRDALVDAPTRMIAAGREGIERLHDQLGTLVQQVQVHRYRSRVGGLESAVITHPRATKVDALAELCAYHGVDAAQVLALGDAEIDVDMLQWAGVGVAMGNGMLEARDAAQWIAPSNDDGGVAAAVERFVLRP